MPYSISYEATTPAVRHRCNREAARTEIFRTEADALKRARQLLDEGDHHAVVLCDTEGGTLAGIRLQLRLGFSAE